jgi:DNA polymerase-3 subunit beta
MNITFDKQVLLKTLSDAVGCISNKSTFAYLEGVLLSTVDGGVLISTFDSEKGFRKIIDARVSEGGTYIISCVDLLQYVRVMPDDDVNLIVEDDGIATIKSGRVFYTMHAIDGKTFPIPPEMNEDKKFIISEGNIKEGIARTIHSVSDNDTTHPELRGIYFSVNKDSCKIVACDSFTLAMYEIKEGSNTELEFILPGKSATELAKLLEFGDNEVEIRLARKHVFFVFREIVFFSQLIDVKYIDYERVIPRGLPINVTISRDAFFDSIERAALVSEKKGSGSVRGYVKLSFTPGMLKITSVSMSSQFYDEIECIKDGPDIDIGFNCLFLLSALRAATEGDIKISLEEPRKSMTLIPVNADKAEMLFMVLPVRMIENREQGAGGRE